MSSSESDHFADRFLEFFLTSSLFQDPDRFEPVNEELKLALTIGLDFQGFETFLTCSAQATAPGFHSYYVEGEIPRGLPLGEQSRLLDDAFLLPFEPDLQLPVDLAAGEEETFFFVSDTFHLDGGVTQFH